MASGMAKSENEAKAQINNWSKSTRFFTATFLWINCIRCFVLLVKSGCNKLQ